MNNKKIKLISVLFFLIGIIFPAGFLLRLIPGKIAFPMMFTCLGGQQLFNGFFICKKKTLKLFSISFGTLFIIFTIFIVIPNYYFK